MTVSFPLTQLPGGMGRDCQKEGENSAPLGSRVSGSVEWSRLPVTWRFCFRLPLSTAVLPHMELLGSYIVQSHGVTMVTVSFSSY